jgi:lipid A disaccharide synthetase
MVNLVADELVFEEFLQDAVVPEQLVPALERILPDGERRDTVAEGMARAVGLLGGTCNASRRAAEEALACLSEADRPTGATAQI